MSRGLAAVCVMAIAGAGVLAATAVAKRPGATVRCSAGTYEIAFDPRRAVVVRAGGRELARASFAVRRLSSTCRRSRWILGSDEYLRGGAVRKKTELVCRLPGPVQLHVQPITGSDGRVIGSNLLISAGSQALTAFAAILKNPGDPLASRIYIAPKWCRAGA